MRHCFFILIIILLFTIDSNSQVSVTVVGGTTSSVDPAGDYEFDNKWPSSNVSGSSSLKFLHNGSGSAFQVNVMWEVSKIFSTGLSYQSLSTSTSDTKRHAASSNIGVLFKFNFVRNTRRVVPFAQVGYKFLNQSTLSQEAFSSIIYPNQKQPAVNNMSASSSLGFSVELGTEAMLTNSLSLIVFGGFHGFQLADSNFANTNLSLLSYGTGVQSPQSVDGTFFIQFSGGLKYYFGRQKKKRDF